MGNFGAWMFVIYLLKFKNCFKFLVHISTNMNLVKARNAKKIRSLGKLNQIGRARQVLYNIESVNDETDESSRNDTDDSNNKYDSSRNDTDDCNNAYDSSINDTDECNNTHISSRVHNGLNSIAYIRLQRQYNALKRQHGKLKSANDTLKQSVSKYKKHTHCEHAIQYLCQLLHTKKVNQKIR